MNSELEAIMRRRRRKADGLPGSPSPHRKRGESSTTRSSSLLQQQVGPPPPPPPMPPPPSSVPMARRHKPLRRIPRSGGEADVKKMDASTRRRALDQIRGTRSTFQSEKQKIDSIPRSMTRRDPPVPTSVANPKDTIGLKVDDSIQDASSMAAQAPNDSFYGNDSTAMANLSMTAQAGDDSILADQGPSLKKSPEYHVIPSPPSSSPVRPDPPPAYSPERPDLPPAPSVSSEQESSSVESPRIASPPRQIFSSEDSSSEEPVEEEVETPKPFMEQEEKEPTTTSTFDHFEADFGSFPAFGEDVAPLETEYEPPPVFEAFEPPEPIDYSPVVNPPKRATSEVSLKQTQLLSYSENHCPPIINPLTGNVIVCRSKENQVGLCEIELSSLSQVEYTPILTADVQRKFKSVYGTSAYNVEKVLSMTAGVHRSQGQARVRVAALVEFHYLSQVGKRLSRTALLVWQWGYASAGKPIAIQSVLSPPNKTSFTYDLFSLEMADGLVFLSGHAKGKGPCVFCVKPNADSVWSANLLPGSGKISSIAVTCYPNRKHKYIAIAQMDGSLSVWTYESSVDRKGTESVKTLFPLCRLDGATAIANAEHKVGETETKEPDDPSSFCTDLQWISPSSSCSTMLLLAAAFTNGMAVYHVSLPLLLEKSDGETAGVTKPLPEPTASTQVTQTVLLPPIAASQWTSPTKSASVSWIELGPHVSPCLSFLLERESANLEVVLGLIDMPLDGDSVVKGPYPFSPLSNTTLSSSTDAEESVVGLLCSPSLRSIVLYRNGSVLTLTPVLSCDASYFSSLSSPITSAAPGLDSAGFVSFSDTVSNEDGVLQVFTVQQCQREPCNLESPVANTERLEWSLPKLRYLLCRTFAGDTRDAQEPSPEAQTDEDSVSGGSHVEVICDLTAGPGLVPCRIVRCKGTELCALLFRRGMRHEGGLLTDAVAFALIDTTKKEIVGLKDGRDIVFLPDAKSGCEQALVLSVDGASIQMWRRSPSSEELEKPTPWEEGTPFRALLGVDVDDGYIECRRLATVSSGSKLILLFVGTRVRDERSCLITGECVSFDESSLDAWKSLLPNVKTSSTLWLESEETVESVVELPSYQDGRHLIAVATGRRVLLLSTSMQVLAEISVELSSPSLVALGSHTVAYCSRDFKLRYLCSLQGRYASGLLATLPVPRFGRSENHLVAVRPDRFVISDCQKGARLVEQDESPDSFLLPIASSRPALLLEPMVANALCEADNPGDSTNLLRSVIERFGRKVAPFPHGDDEGVGSLGSGLTPEVLKMLAFHGLQDPASWLLTGTTRFDRAANSKILPPWMPVRSKAAAAINGDAHLHIVANGDQYFSDYVKSPDHNMASTLPRPSDPSAVVCHELARQAMKDGDVAGALKLLDMAGTSSSDSDLLHLALSLELDQSSDTTKVLNALSGNGDGGNLRGPSQSSTTSSLAALALDLKSRQKSGKVPQQDGECEQVSEDFRRRWMTQLAPSLKRERKVQRARHRLIGEDAADKATRAKEKPVQLDSRWLVPCNESKHVWNEGPFKDKENLMLLDRMEEWLGRKRPAILGKEGAAAALERGEKTLADILNRANQYDDDSFGGESGGGAGDSDLKDGWVEGVGEGRTDEDNLSLYLRMSEGADEDSSWRTDGFLDLSQYGNKAMLMGPVECYKLQPTTSSVDEGEPGKVKLLYDLIFDVSKDGEGPAGLLVEAARGSSLDVGMLHGDENTMRQRCSVEFWYRLPQQESVVDDIVLVRRSVSVPDVDIARLCVAGDKDALLWELLLLPSGELEFRSNGGTSLMSSSESSTEFEQNQSMGDFGDTFQQQESGDGGLVSWERQDGSGGWNHVCLVFSSRRHRSINDCTVTLFMKGLKVGSTVASIVPPGLEGDVSADVAQVDETMKKTVYLFGLNAVTNYRMTELRLWSCERSEDDIKFMMYESLRAAETKKKFKVKIRNKRCGSTAGAKEAAGNLLSPPKDSRAVKGLLPPPRKRTDVDISPKSSDEKKFVFDASFRAFGNAGDEARIEKDNNRESIPEPIEPPTEPSPDTKPSAVPKERRHEDAYQIEANVADLPPENVDFRDSTVPMGQYEYMVRLSREVRSSAAAALIRGPPATRHFGGNRGGLAQATRGDRVITKRFGVGAIAICGAEKTVVYDHDQTPPGKTYPIGASGAVISDEMDNGEYLCCFLAKDKRMVVFELMTRTVVVELQMTTKLNFWRYLPPQAHGHTLVFMLITPVGGFHWLPLDESPRPRQVWKRGPALQGKKIVTYEEGGSNGFHGAEALSAVALLLVSTASTGTPLEAWILQVGGESQALCVSSNVLGAALFRPYHIDDESFLPHLVTATGVESEIVIKVEPLVQNPATGELAAADVSIGAIIDQSQVRRFIFTPPALAMGGWPEVICCCCEGIVVACVRRKGLVVAYDCQEELVLIRQEHVDNYIVDGSLRPGKGDVDVEIVLLLADSENPRDGFVMSIGISRL